MFISNDAFLFDLSDEFFQAMLEDEFMMTRGWPESSTHMLRAYCNI